MMEDKLDVIRARLAGRFQASNFKRLMATLQLKPQTVEVVAVTMGGGHISVRWPDGTEEALSAEEIASVDLISDADQSA
jgi:hypothetical protein